MVNNALPLNWFTPYCCLSPTAHKQYSFCCAVFKWIYTLALWLLLLTSPASTHAQSKTQWRLQLHDCQLQGEFIDHRMAIDPEFHLQECEVFDLKVIRGSKLTVSFPIEPVQIIPELVPEVWVKSNREDIRLAARVVYPNSKKANGDGPVVDWIWGPRYKQQNRWQHLSYRDMPSNIAESFARQLWSLREQHGSHLQSRGAYIDQLKLELFDGTGHYNVAIGKVNINGAARFHVEGETKYLEDFSDIQKVTWQPRTTDARRDGTVLEVDGQAFFARVIQHNGESFEFLREMGFNTVQLPTVATETQLAAAKANNLWIICPPPPDIGLKPLGFGYDRVLAWEVGNNIQARDLRRVEQTVREIRASDPHQSRPIFANVQSSWSDFVHVLDILSTGVAPLGTTFSVNRYGSWINSRSLLASNRIPIFADIQTESDSALAFQSAAFVGQIPPMPISKEQMQCLAFEAISGGARGLRFTSRTRLDTDDLATQLRCRTLIWLLAQLNMFEPWVAGGAVEGEVSTGDPSLKITSIKTQRARLFLLQRLTGHEQWVAGEVELKKTVFNDLNTATDRAYLINEMGVRPLSSPRSHTGATIAVEDCPQNAAIVLTQDALVINRLSGNVANQNTMIVARRDITRNWIAIEQLVLDQLAANNQVVPIASGALREAQSYFEQAERLIRTNSQNTSIVWMDKADQRLALARKKVIEHARSQFASPSNPPLLSHFALVPQHWNTARRLSGRTWHPNALPGGDFESLNQLTNTGWSNQKWGVEKFQSLVELSPTAARGGKTGLRMVVQPPKRTNGQIVVENTPVWITSAPVAVKTGQMVRIHGWVNVPAAIAGSDDGAMIIDSIGGGSLAERVFVTNGWQEFSIYRAVLQDTDLRLTFAMTGVGQVYFDEVTVRAVDLPSPVRRPASNPANDQRQVRRASSENDATSGMLNPLTPKLEREIR